MLKNLSILGLALAFAAGCATQQEAPKPAPAPEQPKPAPEKPKPVAEKVTFAADVLFDFDKSDLRAEADATLGKAATVLAAYPGAKVTISGHTDSKGDGAYNQALSERRAQSVTAWLRAHGGKAPATFVVRGAGEREPVAPNTRSDGSDDPAARQKNRRVEILVQTKR